MRSFRNFLALTAVITAFSIVNVSAQNFSSGNQRSVRTIEQQVFKKILGLPYYGVFDHITFQVKGGTVILDGKTNSLGTKRSAESVVKRIPGVTSVINNIDELPPSSFDNTIRRQTLQTFANRGLYRYFLGTNPSVRIIVDRGRTTLEGYVANRGDYNALNIYANGISGVFSVTNNLMVDSAR